MKKHQKLQICNENFAPQFIGEGFQAPSKAKKFLWVYGLIVHKFFHYLDRSYHHINELRWKREGSKLGFGP